jgi:hypothetical protein
MKKEKNNILKFIQAENQIVIRKIDIIISLKIICFFDNQI